MCHHHTSWGLKNHIIAAINNVKDLNGRMRLDGIWRQSNSKDIKRKLDDTNKVCILNKQDVIPSSTHYRKLHHTMQHVSRQQVETRQELIPSCETSHTHPPSRGQKISKLQCLIMTCTWDSKLEVHFLPATRRREEKKKCGKIQSARSQKREEEWPHPAPVQLHLEHQSLN